ncbi:MAG: VirB4 family type IV secretion system protein, partial [Actinomycetota bacterium]
MGALGIPVVLAGTTGILSSSKRMALAVGIGSVSCFSAVALFAMAYSRGWGLIPWSTKLVLAGTYGLGFLLLVLATGVAFGSRSHKGDEPSPPEAGSTETANDESDNGTDQNASGGTGSESTHGSIDADLSDLHATLVSAPSVVLTSKAAQVGEDWVKTLVIVDFPDTAGTGMLDRALTRVPDIDLDYSIHVRPRDPTRTIGELKKSIRDLKVKQAEKAERGDVTQIDTEQTLEDHQAIYSQLVGGAQQIFDVSIYLTVRGDGQEAVEQAAERVTRNLQSVQMTAKTATYRQADALVSTSPIGKDIVGQTATMLGGAVGALYPFTSGTVIEESGVLMGYHSVTGSPVVVDRFAREKGYNCFIAGNTGAGKTFNTILGLLRTYAKDEDTMVIVADPFGDLGALTDILDGERVVLSGKRGLNPLEITPTPASVLEANPDLDPYTKAVQKDVMEFIQAFFAMEGMSLTGKRGVLSVAIKEAYRRQGITPDPTTHHNESPTFRDVLDVLDEISKHPAEYVGGEPDTVPDIEADLWLKRAGQLRMDMAPFREGGEYANLARETEIDLTGSDVLYLDMQQIEGKQKTGLMLQLVLRAVYERAKQTDKKVIFAIDEAHYLMQNEASLSFLERATRHARHYDLSRQLITQTVDEFFSRADSDELAQKTKAIADNCVLKIFHQVEGLTDANADEWLDLSPPEAEFIRSAKPGSDEYGYSQALIEVGEEGRFPINVHALPEEEALITNASTDKGHGGEQSPLEVDSSSNPGQAANDDGIDSSDETETPPAVTANGAGQPIEEAGQTRADTERESTKIRPDQSQRSV